MSEAAQKLLALGRRARHAQDMATLKFILANETYTLAPYQIALVWMDGEGVVAQSGVSHIEPTSPFVMWANRVCTALSSQQAPVVVAPAMIDPADVPQWSEYLPPRALWVPIDLSLGDAAPEQRVRAGLLLARDEAWPVTDVSLVAEWVDIWAQAWRVQYKPSMRKRLGRGWRGLTHMTPIKRLVYGVLVLAFLFFPVRLTILAPGELVPSNPSVIRVPIEGVIEAFSVQPNERVKAGDPLFKLDLTALVSKLQLARQEMEIASAEYRQSALQSLSDPKSRSMLTPQEGRALERQLEADYLQQLLEKAQIESPRDGLVIFDDPLEWVGRPVVAGEKVMVVAAEDDMEIEVWVPLNEAIDLEPGAAVTLYLNTAPFDPVRGQLRYLGHEAVARPDGSYAYRMRARIAEPGKAARIGLRGTAKVSGEYVSLAYWVLRKPIVALRQFIGI